MPLLFVYVKTNVDVEFLLVIIVCLLVSQAFIAISQSLYPKMDETILTYFQSRVGLLGQGYVQGIYRARGTIGDYELLAEWLACGIPLVLALKERKKLINRIYPLIVLAFLGGILATSTRGGIVIAGVATLIFLFWRFRHNPIKAVSFTLALIFISIGSFYLLNSFFPAQSDKLLERFSSISLNTSGSRLVNTPLEVVLGAINRQMWFNQPSFVTDFRLTGYGFMALDFLGYKNVGSLHSLYLTIWFQGGLLGFLAWLWLIIASIGRSGVLPDSRNILIGGLLSLILAMFLSEIKIEFLRYEHTIQYFFLQIGMIVALLEITKKTLYRNKNLTSAL